MRFFTFALGVRCQFCHVGREGMPLDSFDFRSDSLRTKRTARVMLDMLAHINGEHLAMVPERPTPNVVVTCFTCHHGVSRPFDLPTILLRTAREASADSAVKTYRALRQQYWGRASYDFGEPTLDIVSDGLMADHRTDDALTMLRLNEEFFPRSPMLPMRFGEAYLAKGDTANAITSYRKALEFNPQNQFVRRRLAQLGVTQQ